MAPTAANNALPAGSARIAFGGQGRWCASDYQSVSGRSTKAPLGEPGSVVVVVGGAVVVVTASVVVVAAGDVVVVVTASVVVVAAGDVVVVVTASVVVVAAGDVVVVVTTSVVVVAAGDVVVVVAVGAVVVVSDGTEVVVVSCGGDVVVVLVPPEMHEPSAHASQQLGSDPTHAVPSCGALQSLSLCLMLHFVWPCSSVRQQVTKSGLPQVDCAAQCTTASLHSWRSDPSLVAASATCCTQLMYLP